MHRDTCLSQAADSGACPVACWECEATPSHTTAVSKRVSLFQVDRVTRI